MLKTNKNFDNESKRAKSKEGRQKEEIATNKIKVLHSHESKSFFGVLTDKIESKKMAVVGFKTTETIRVTRLKHN